MPRIVHRDPFLSRLKDTLELPWVESTYYYCSSLWESFYGYLGFYLWRLLYVLLILHRVSVVTDQDYEPSPMGLLEISMLLTSFGAGLFCLTQHKDYTFSERDPREKPIGSNHFHLVDKADSVPPFYKETNLGRILYPLYSWFGKNDDIDSKVWVLRIWDPSGVGLRILSWVSPAQILLYKWMPRERAYLFAAAIITLAYIQRKTIELYEQMAKDKEIINAQVQLEYNVNFVGPRACRPSSESATQCGEVDVEERAPSAPEDIYPHFTFQHGDSTPERDLTRTNPDFGCPIDRPSPHKDYVNIFQKSYSPNRGRKK